MTRAFIFIFCFAVLLFSAARSQNNPVSSYASLAEKIYLQLDNTVYTTGQTIWFKAIVANAADHTPTKLSGILYAELIDPHENIVERKLIKIEQGLGNGFFQLASNYAYGVYQVRAYTEWDKNFGSDFFFKEYVLISGQPDKKQLNPITNLTVIEASPNERRLQVTLDPSATDTIAGKKIRLMIETNGRKDTLSPKKNRDDQYLLDYVIPAKSEMVTVQVETANQVNYSKTIVLDTNYFDLQFFPESGELVQNLPAHLGFKATDYTGKGRLVEGKIIDAEGNVVTSFRSNELGMGSVDLPFADSAAKYVAKIFVGKEEQLQKTFLLPAVVARGNILSVKKIADKILLKASSNYMVNDSMMVRASCRGIVYFDFRVCLKNGEVEFSIPAKELPEGIIDFTLLTHLMMPVAERLYFNEKAEERIDIAVSSDKQEYSQREKTELTIETKDINGQPIPANLSLLVFNRSRQEKTQDLRQNILSYFLLNSDIRGEIESPAFYFNNDTDRFDDLDALLLTQGWRKYNYTKEPIAFQFQPETNLVVSGTVKGGFSNNKVMKGAQLTMLAFGKNSFIEQQRTDSLGRFSFPLNDSYEQNLDVVIQSNDKSNKKKDYEITLDKKVPPPVSFDHAGSIQKPDSIVQAYIKQMVDNKKKEDDYKSAHEGIVLEEVIVKSRVLSSEQKAVTEKYGEANIVIDGNTIRAKEEKWSFGLYSILLYNFPDKINIRRLGNGMLYASLYNGLPTIVIIDGIVIRDYNYGFIPGIPPSEVKSFEIIEDAKNFRSAYCEFYPDGCRRGGPAWGNIIAIYTYAGKGLEGIRPTIGITKTSVPVFSTPREFYTPKYDQLKPDDWQKPDLRDLIYWSPDIKTDTTGRSFISFYNSDNTGKMQIVVEAISADGEIGYHEYFFDVDKRK